MADSGDVSIMFERLSDHFHPSEVRTRTGAGGMRLEYITARSAMARLDSVVGPENWKDSYRPWGEDALICRIEVRINGEWIGKEDVGGKADMGNADDSDKSSASHAFKRAAVKWGVGRYLYKDGIPGQQDERRAGPAPAPPAPRSVPQRGDRSGGGGDVPTTGRALFYRLKEIEERNQIPLVKQVANWAKDQGLKGRMVDWPREAIADAWVFACGSVRAQPPVNPPGGMLPGAYESVEARDPGQEG